MLASFAAGGAAPCRRRRLPRDSGSRWRSSCGRSNSSTGRGGPRAGGFTEAQAATQSPSFVRHLVLSASVFLQHIQAVRPSGTTVIHPIESEANLLRNPWRPAHDELIAGQGVAAIARTIDNGQGCGTAEGATRCICAVRCKLILSHREAFGHRPPAHNSPRKLVFRLAR